MSIAPHHKISGAEIAEILGIGWKEFLEWSRGGGLPPAEPPYGGMSLAEEPWWYLGIVLRRHPDCELAYELEQRYEGRALKTVSRHAWEIEQVDPFFWGHKIYAQDLLEIFECSWRTLVIKESQPEFPKEDGKWSDRLSSKYWWATTLVVAFPDPSIVQRIRKRIMLDLDPVVLDNEEELLDG